MPIIHVTDLSGETRTIEAEVGLTLMEAIRDAGLDDLQAICGGCCSCATCHVHVAQAWLAKLPEPESDEAELVCETESYRPNSRLSCQIELTEALDGLEVTIAPAE
ncbi:MAG: ferredoxin [Alphaproteobacteria bacterium]|nr:MAG: ferredoxin [Alphaproteobacteria bacterium]